LLSRGHGWAKERSRGGPQGQRRQPALGTAPKAHEGDRYAKSNLYRNKDSTPGFCIRFQSCPKERQHTSGLESSQAARIERTPRTPNAMRRWETSGRAIGRACCSGRHGGLEFQELGRKPSRAQRPPRETDVTTARKKAPIRSIRLFTESGTAENGPRQYSAGPCGGQNPGKKTGDEVPAILSVSPPGEAHSASRGAVGAKGDALRELISQGKPPQHARILNRVGRATRNPVSSTRRSNLVSAGTAPTNPKTVLNPRHRFVKGRPVP